MAMYQEVRRCLECNEKFISKYKGKYPTCKKCFDNNFNILNKITNMNLDTVNKILDTNYSKVNLNKNNIKKIIFSISKINNYDNLETILENLVFYFLNEKDFSFYAQILKKFLIFQLILKIMIIFIKMMNKMNFLVPYIIAHHKKSFELIFEKYMESLSCEKERFLNYIIILINEYTFCNCPLKIHFNLIYLLKY